MFSREVRTYWIFLFAESNFLQASNSFEGIPRFIAELPPVYIAFAMWTDRTPRRPLLMLVVLGALFAAYAALWALGVHAVQN